MEIPIETKNQTQKGHPKGLYLLFFTEMWERFSYYGMRAIFMLYLLNALMINKSEASKIYGSYTGLVYLTPLIGGYISDRYWGNRRSILVGGLLMAVGQFCMFLSASYYTNFGFANTLMLLGLGCLIMGNGFFKPNISTMVGSLYTQTDPRKDAAFTIFYMGINLGAFFAPLVCGALGEHYDSKGNPLPEYFKWGFLAACIGMLISILSFELLKNKFLITPSGEPIGGKPDPTKFQVQNTYSSNKQNITRLIAWVVGSLILFTALPLLQGESFENLDWIGIFIYSLTLAAPGSIITDPTLTKIERARIWVIFISAFFVIAFWAAFEQAGASLTIFAAEQTNRNIFGWEMPASYFQSFNAIFIVILAPVFSIIWENLNKKGLEPSSPLKQAYGLLFLAIGYLVIALGVKNLDPNIKVSMLWLTSLYLLHTIGELCLSPIGLSMVNKLAPVRFASLLMGVWFLSTATANKLAGVLSQLYPDPKNPKKPVLLGFQINDLYDFFMVFVVFSGLAALIMFALSRKLTEMMHEGK
jgi:POT family proton-dependent oligopeptide transporter